jgi:iron complex transport system ATP-binding protein
MNQFALTTKNLSIGYLSRGKHEKVLHSGINLELKNGEITCLLGPNGSGKSTLIRTIAGFQKAIAGEVYIDEKPISGIPVNDLAKNVSVVLTDEVFTGNITVFDMVAFGRSPYTGFMGRLGEEDWKIVEQSLNETGITHLHNRVFPELSDGEKQKVMIAKSLAQQTLLILLDEPTAYLDFPSKVEVLQLLRNAAWNMNKSILLSTHDLVLALRFADNIWLMGNDKKMEKGVPEDIVLNGQINQFFDRENTTFDPESGDFEFNTISKGDVVLNGEGIKAKWLTKALLRKGYRINKMKESKVQISVIGEKITLISKEEKSIFDSISEVLDFLENKTLVSG